MAVFQEQRAGGDFEIPVRVGDAHACTIRLSEIEPNRAVAIVGKPRETLIDGLSASDVRRMCPAEISEPGQVTLAQKG